MWHNYQSIIGRNGFLLSHNVGVDRRTTVCLLPYYNAKVPNILLLIFPKKSSRCSRKVTQHCKELGVSGRCHHIGVFLVYRFFQRSVTGCQVSIVIFDYGAVSRNRTSMTSLLEGLTHTAESLTIPCVDNGVSKAHHWCTQCMENNKGIHRRSFAFYGLLYSIDEREGWEQNVDKRIDKQCSSWLSVLFSEPLVFRVVATLPPPYATVSQHDCQVDGYDDQ